MPASFFFASEDHQFFKVPKLAFQTLGRTNHPNLDRFFNFPVPPAARLLQLGNHAVLMCGTSGNLHQALTLMNTKISGFNVAQGKRLCVHYARIRNSADLQERTLVCLASLQDWWHVSEFGDVSTERAFAAIPIAQRKNLKDFKSQMSWLPLVEERIVRRGIGMDDLIRYVGSTINHQYWLDVHVPRWGQPG